MNYTYRISGYDSNTFRVGVPMEASISLQCFKVGMLFFQNIEAFGCFRKYLVLKRLNLTLQMARHSTHKLVEKV